MPTYLWHRLGQSNVTSPQIARLTRQTKWWRKLRNKFQKNRNSPKQIGQIKASSFGVYWPFMSQYSRRYFFRRVRNQNPRIWFWYCWRVDHLRGLSREEPCRIKYHYWSTHVQVFGKGAERWCQSWISSAG